MFWGHDGELFATSVIKRDMGDVKHIFGTEEGPTRVYYVYIQKPEQDLHSLTIVFYLLLYLMIGGNTMKALLIK